MVIKLKLNDEGHIEVDSSAEPDFVMSDHGIDLTMAFTTISRTPTNLVLAPGDRLFDSLRYIIKELKSNGFRIQIEGYLKSYLDNYENEEKIIEKISKRKPRYKPCAPRNPEFTKDLLPHQKREIGYALEVDNTAIFSVPGSGKTRSALGAFAEWKYNGDIERILLIGPASSFEPWKNEFEECFGRLPRALRWSGSTRKRHRLLSSIENSEIILCTYQTACNDAILLEKILRKDPTLLILDESHYIKNFYGGVRASVVLGLAPFAKKRMILTGTPAPHSLLDLWTQFSFLWTSQRLLGTRYEYETLLNSSSNSVGGVSSKIKEFFYRTKKSELKLPAPQEHILRIKKNVIPPAQQRIIELLEIQTYSEARRQLSHEEDVDTLRRWRAARIIRLLQAASNPALLLGAIDKDIGDIPDELDIDIATLREMASMFSSGELLPAKIEAVIQKAIEIIESGRKVVIWTWFIKNLRLLSHLLKDYHPLLLYGAIKPYEDEEDTELEESRERNIREFKERKDRPLLIANPMACAESISLHKHCHDAIYLDRNFNCGQFLQSMDRIHRVGLPPNTTTNYYIAVVDCAIERSVNKRLQSRQRVLYQLMDDDMPVIGIDEDMWVAENSNELDLAYDELIKDLQQTYRTR